MVVLVVRSDHPVCPENEICAAPIEIVDISGSFAGLVLPLSKCLVNRDSETDRVFRGEVYPSLTVRAYNGLSWDTPTGIIFRMSCPRL